VYSRRFEADRPNEVWIGDVLVGPFVPHPRTPGSQRAYLFVLVDHYSRLLVHSLRRQLGLKDGQFSTRRAT